MPAYYSDGELQQMDMDAAINLLNVNIFGATEIIDALERAGKLGVNAAFVRNEICANVRQIIEQRWIG